MACEKPAGKWTTVAAWCGMMRVFLGLETRALARSLAFCAALAAAGLSEQAAAQAQALPQDVAQAIEEAIRLSDLAAANAAFSADIANPGQQTGIAERTRLYVTQSNLAVAVVEGIARHPLAVSSIVSAAVKRAPGHSQAIVDRASIAFPRFASIIAAAAGMPPPAQTPLVLPYTTPAPTYATAPPAPSAQTATPPAIRAVQAVPTEPMAPPRMRTPAATSSPWSAFGVSELRFGIVHHDAGVFGRNKEDGVDITLGVRFQPLTGGTWELLQNPRPFIGANINTSGETSTFDFGLNWDWNLWRGTFASFAFGGAAHTGKTENARLDRKELGSRVLFYLAAELGYRINQRHSLALRLDHMSNASLAKNNEGLDTAGLVYGYHF